MSTTSPKYVLVVMVILPFLFFSIEAGAGEWSGEEFYRHLSSIAAGGDTSIVEKLNRAPSDFDWSGAAVEKFRGHLRYLTLQGKSDADTARIYFIRSTEGRIFLLSIPDLEDSKYEDLENWVESKLDFHVRVIKADIDGRMYTFARFVDSPVQPVFDRIFKLMIVLMLFLVMVGMGLTLTGADFAVLISRPGGMIIGEVLQFGVMPLVAMALGYAMGFHANYPYIYVGMILITATPGGVTSNLMTHYAKGDVALSVSLTSLSTVLSIFFVPLLLKTYCAGIPDVEVPVKTIALTIVVLVLIPLGIGMLLRKVKEEMAKKLIPVFSLLGIIALLFLIVAGILSNLEAFADTERHGFRFYTMVFLLTVSGMAMGGAVPALFRVSNFQIRAISLETGLRNASLAMTMALLIQDSMGDFHSSMFYVSGMFGLAMYIAGVVAIKIYPVIFPLKQAVEEKINRTAGGGE